jgi:hypothetical protein
VGVLNAQGRAAGESGSQGLAILDFGRPAANGPVFGTVNFRGDFESFRAIEVSTESYIRGYFATAPSHFQLNVAIGTNDSCGTGQPCGGIRCGCEFEPTSFAAWGAQQAIAVEKVQSQTTSLKIVSGYTDTVTIMAGDDAEPAFDPGYRNTFDLMAGYSHAVDGYLPAMVDYGSAAPGFWSNSQLLQIANGFLPNLAVPEIYSGADAKTWASLASYAKAAGTPLTIFGVLTATPAGSGFQTGPGDMVNALLPITGQSSLQWFSNIDPSVVGMAAARIRADLPTGRVRRQRGRPGKCRWNLSRCAQH